MLAAFLGLMLAAEARGNELTKVSELLRPLIVQHLPNPLHVKQKEWGRTSSTFSRMSWSKFKVIKVPKNDGNWRKWTVTARDPAQHFALVLTEIPGNAQQPGSCRASLSLPVAVELEQQLWENGIRLLSRSVRVRLRIKAEFDYTISVVLDTKPGALIPEAVIRPKVSNVQVSYDDLVVEHIAGVGGTTAKVVGKALLELVDEVKPSLEEDLLAKAEAAVVKAANKQEIRVNLQKWLSK